MRVVAFPSCRLVLTILGFFGMVNCYTLRVNLSVAIVAMVNATWLHELEDHHKDNQTASVCAVDEEDDNTTHIIEDVRMINCLFSTRLTMLEHTIANVRSVRLSITFVIHA